MYFTRKYKMSTREKTASRAQWMHRIASFLPDSLKREIRQHFDFTSYQSELALQSRPSDLPAEENYNSKYKLRIVEEYSGYHYSYIQSCRDLKVSYKVLDLGASDWVRTFSASDCDAFMLWPPSS